MEALIRTVLDRIVRVLSEQQPIVLASLRPPARPEELTELESLFGTGLAPEVRELYRWHNGAEGVVNAFRLAGDFMFVSTVEAAAERATMNNVVSDVFPHSSEAARVWRSTWLPIGSSYAGSLLVVDHEPGDTYGSVFPWEHGNGARRDRGWSDLVTALTESLDSLRSSY